MVNRGKTQNNYLFLMLNSSLIPHIKKCSLKGDGVVVFIHKFLNCKIIHDLSKSNGIVEIVKRKKR